MTFEVAIEHKLVNGKAVVERFENVVKLFNPTVSETTVLKMEDGTEQKIKYGTIITIDANKTSNE